MLSQISAAVRDAADAGHLHAPCTRRWRSGRWPAGLALGAGSARWSLYDFCYYWHHRAGHRVALFWAAHVVHHQSEDYNLSTALRQTSGGWLLGWIFYLPMAMAGVPPLVFGVVALIDLLYQYWVHTRADRQARLVRPLVLRAEQPPRAPRGERPLPRPQLRRHPDRLGPAVRQLRAEDDAEPCVYGTRAPLRSWNPLWANLQVYAELAQGLRGAPRRWADKLRVWFKPPGWRPADVAARWPKPAFDIARGAALRPAAVARAAWLATLLFVGAAGGDGGAAVATRTSSTQRLWRSAPPASSAGCAPWRRSARRARRAHATMTRAIPQSDNPRQRGDRQRSPAYTRRVRLAEARSAN